MKPKSLEYALRSMEIESRAIGSMTEYLDRESFARAVEILSTCDKIVTCASGSSGIAARKFSHSLNCIERSAQFLSPDEAVHGTAPPKRVVHGGLGCVKKDNAVVIVSRGGKTAELLPVIDVCCRKEARIIGITENLDSALARQSTVVVPLQIERESDKCNIMATASFVVTIALFDAMLSAIMAETGYKIEQFSLIHPGGAVGELLGSQTCTLPNQGGNNDFQE